MGFQLSPGVVTSEIDLTTIIPAVATSIGAFAGKFGWGPVNTVMSVSDEVRLVDRFGKPDANNFEYWFSAANFLAYANNLRIVRAANTTSTLNATANTSGVGVLIESESDYEANHSAGTTVYGEFAARWPGAIGNSLKVAVCPSANAYSSNLTSQTGIKTQLSELTGNTLIEIVGGTVSDYVTAGDYVSFDGGTNYIQVASVTDANITLSSAVTANVVANTSILRRWEYATEFTGAPGTSDYVANLGGSKDELHVIVIDEDGLFSGTPGTVLEKYEYASKASDGKDSSGNTSYYANQIEQKSKYIWWLSHVTGGSNWGTTAAAKTFAAVEKNTPRSLAGGAEGDIGNAEILTAYGKFANGDTIDISLLIAGPSNATVVNYLIDNIATIRKDCVVFASVPKSAVVDNVGNETTDSVAFRDTLTSTSYAVLDGNWKYQYDKYGDVYRWIPCNSDIAGLCARTDNDRDPWFSPGGLNRGIIKNVVKLAYNPVKSERDDLYVKSINPVVAFAGEGTVLFGDKTLQAKPSAFDRINVRRLFIVIEKAIARASRYSLFEFNDAFTRAQFVSMVEPYLRDIQGRRGITDFRVVCDASNNTGEVIDGNRFIGDIYIKPARSINFIQLNFVAVRTGVSFDEVVGKF